jgi:NitT/TauT family transport system ATP-binding protein
LQVSVAKLFYAHNSASNLPVLENISFTVNEGEFVSLIGPSGCGKTTLLQLIAGLLPLQEGKIVVQQPATASKAAVACTMLFQDLRLFYWMTARENVAAALRARGIGRREALAEACFYLRRFALEDFARTYPDQLSGGMRQRLALARALATSSRVLLLDEPFSNLDPITQQSVEGDLLRVWKDDRLTIVLVTHDHWEAIRLSDRVIVLSSRPATIKGVVKIDSPRPREHRLINSDIEAHLQQLSESRSREHEPAN